MPTYSYACTACGAMREDDCSISGFREHRPPCGECGGECEYRYVPSVPQVVFKDGPSGSWPSKGGRIKKQRTEASAAAARRQRDRYGEPKKAVPNFEGKDTGSWQEAGFQALRERGPESAATYADKIKEEKAADKTVKVVT